MVDVEEGDLKSGGGGWIVVLIQLEKKNSSLFQPPLPSFPFPTWRSFFFRIMMSVSVNSYTLDR